MEDVGRFAVILCLSLPMAGVVVELERRLRERENQSITEVARMIKARGEGRLSFSGLVTHALARTALAYGGVFWIGLTALALASIPIFQIMRVPNGGELAWSHLWLAAGVGGTLSLRIRRAYGVLAAAACLAVMLGFLAR